MSAVSSSSFNSVKSFSVSALDKTDQVLTKSLSFLSNNYLYTVILVLLILYAPAAAPMLSKSMVGLLGNYAVKFIYIFLLSYLLSKSVKVSIVTTVAIVVGIFILKKFSNNENFDGSGTDLSGNGVSGNGVSGNGVYGNGVSGNGVYGNGVSGNGVSGNGVYGNGVSGNGVYGNGVSENDVYGTDLSGNGVSENDVSESVSYESVMSETPFFKTDLSGNNIIPEINMQQIELPQELVIDREEIIKPVMQMQAEEKIPVGADLLSNVYADADYVDTLKPLVIEEKKEVTSATESDIIDVCGSRLNKNGYTGYNEYQDNFASL
jgi:hypothetical protein